MLLDLWLLLQPVAAGVAQGGGRSESEMRRWPHHPDAEMEEEILALLA